MQSNTAPKLQPLTAKPKQVKPPTAGTAMKKKIHAVKINLWRFIAERIFKVKRGQILPRFLQFIRFVIFPLEMTKMFFNRKFGIFDFAKDYFIICGRGYPRVLFETLRYNGENQDYRTIIESAREI